MITQTYTYANFYYSNNDFDKFQKTYTNELRYFTETQVDVNLEQFLIDLKSYQNLIDEAKVESIAIFHTLFYKNQCNTEFSPKILELMNSLNATFCITTQILSEKENLYELLDEMRNRTALYLGEVSITKLEAFINGFHRGQNGETQEKPSFDGFNNFIDTYYNDSSSAGWRNKILANHYGNEKEAIAQFYILLDEFRLEENKPNSKNIIYRLLRLSYLDFREENEHERQKQIADLLHNIPSQIKNSSNRLYEYDEILQNIFDRSRKNIYLHNWLKCNVLEIVFYEYQIDSKTKTAISNELAVNKSEKPNAIFFALNKEYAAEIVRNWEY